MTLHELQRRLKGFNIRQEVVNTIRETEPDIRVLNQGQLSLGLLTTGKEIKNLFTNSYFYSVTWSRERKRAGRQTEFFDLNYSGVYWSSIGVKNISYTKYEVFSRDIEKRNDIEEMFGPNVLGMSKESKKEEYVPLYFAPLLRKKINEKLGV